MYSVIYGNCGGGLSIIPALSDFTYMVEGKGRLFVNSPNAIDANYQEKMDTADGKFKELYSGIVDECLPEEEIQAKVRRLLQLLPGNNTEGIYTGDCQDDLNRLIVEMNASNYETKVLLSNLGDGYEFLETKCEYAPDMITGFIQLNGMTIGTIANREDSERLTVDGLLKGTDFVRFCDAYDIPLLVVADTCGFETSMVAEKAIGRSMASFVSALCEADVPKVTLLPHKAMGSAYLLMNSKSMGADFVYAWPDAELGILPAKEAVEILYAKEQNIDKAQKQASYEQTHNSVSAFAKRAQIDRVIDPESTRKYLVSAFDLLYTKYSCVQDKKHNLR